MKNQSGFLGSKASPTGIPLLQGAEGSRQLPNYSGAEHASVLTLGNTHFYDFEIPEHIDALGGDQVTALHEFVGGTRQVQSLGPQPVPINWSGILYGSDPVYGAAARALSIDLIRQAGSIVSFNWNVFKLEVVVSEFHITPEIDWKIPYHITCIPILDRNVYLTGGASGPDEVYSKTDARVKSALNSYTQSWQTGNQGAATSAFQNMLQASSQKITNFASMPTASLTNMNNFLTQAISDLAPVVSSSGFTSDAAQASVLQLQIGNMVSTVLGSTGSALETTPLINPNLYELSTLIYGNPGQWRHVASANNIQTDTPLLRGSYPKFIISPMPIGRVL